MTSAIQYISLLDFRSLNDYTFADPIDYNHESYEQLGNVSAASIFSDNANYPLRVSSYTKLELEARNNIDLFVPDTSNINFKTTTWDAQNARVDKAYMIMKPEEVNKSITLKPDNVDEYSILNIEYPIMTIGKNSGDDLYVNSKTEFRSKVICLSELYSHNLKVFREDLVTSHINGYVFQINEENRLELLKVKKINDDVYTTSVAIFGYGDVNTNSPNMNHIFNPGNYNNPLNPGSQSGITLLTTSIIPSSSEIDIGNEINPINEIHAIHVYAQNFHTVSPTADFAERIEKENYDDVFMPGDIVGINADGKLTKKFSKSLHFGIVSDSGAIIAHAGLTDENSEIIAFSGRVKVATSGNAGEYLVPVGLPDDMIGCDSVNESEMSLPQYMKSIGHVITLTESGLPYVIVKH
jgi:hypothetical protein